ncbi:MAG: GAF domain-containing protein [Chloroflexota bacterium]
MLRVGCSGHHDFAPTEISLLSLVAYQAAQALEHTRLVEEAHRRVHEAETLYQTGAIVASTLHSDEAIDRILQQLERVIPYDSASIQLLKNGRLEIVGGRGWEDPDAVIGLCFSIPGDNPNTHVVQQRQAHILHNAPGSYPTFAQYPHAHIKSWLGVPLIIQDQVIGMLAVDSKKEQRFSAADANLSLAFANQVAIAMRNTQLYEASQRQLQELKVLHAIADAAVEAARGDVIIERATEILRTIFYPHVLGILLFDEETSMLRAHASYHEEVGVMHTEVPLERGIIGYVARTGQPKRIADVRQEPLYVVGDPQVLSELCVPIKVGKRTLGVLNAESPELNAFGPDDERFLMTIAGQLAAALERLRNEQEVHKLASAVEQTADLIYITDRHGTLKYVNPAFETLTGYTKAEVLGKTLASLGLGWPNEQQFLDSWQDVRDVQHFRGIAINRKKNGKWYYEEKTITPLRDWQDDRPLFVHAGKDITSRMQREQEREAILMVATALRKAETRAEMTPIVLQQVRSLVQADGAAFIMYDAEAELNIVELAVGSVASVSDEGVSLMPSDICGYVVATIKLLSIVRHTHCLLRALSWLPPGVACVPLTIQQQAIGALWVGRQMVFTDEEVPWLVAIAIWSPMPLTGRLYMNNWWRKLLFLEQRVAERTQELASSRQLQALDRLKSKFVSDVSHELRTPVHNLQLYLDLLQRGKAENTEKYQRVLQQQAERLEQLIESTRFVAH